MINIDKIDIGLKETRIYQEFLSIINEFLINAHKFFELVQNLHKKLSIHQKISIETMINQGKFPDLISFLPPKQEIQSQSPIKPVKNCENLDKILKTPKKSLKSSLNWKIADKSPEENCLEIDLEVKNNGSAIREIIDKSFEKKIQKGHCFLYEENDKEMEKSWKELLNLRSEITKLLWEEEKRVKSTISY